MLELRFWSLIVMIFVVAATFFTAIAVYCYLSGRGGEAVFFMMCSLASVAITGFGIRKVGKHL